MCWLLTAGGILAGGLVIFAASSWHDRNLRESDVWHENWTDKNDWR